MDQKKLHRLFAFAVFVISTLIYFATVQPTVSFWDCGEFIASSTLLQVPHPPGTPFFLILGRFFSMIPFAENIGLRVNTISVLASGLSILFLYLIAVKLIKLYKGGEPENLFQAFVTYLSAAIGAFSLAFGDTFWFNAVEAEVYAMSTFFIAFIAWLVIEWYEKADDSDNEKYLIFIAYLIGLSTGVHLMAVLGIVPIVMIIMYRKYITDDKILLKSNYILIGHAVFVLIIGAVMWASQTSSTPPSPDVYKQVDLRFLLIFSGISALFMLAFRKDVFNKNSVYIPLIIGGIALLTVYPGVVKYLPNLISFLGKNDITLDIAIIAALLAALGYLIYWTNKTEKATLNLIFKCLLFAFLGFTSYASIIIRSNQDTPINLNSPKTFSEVVSYLNREQYGDFPTLKRRFSQEPHQQGIYTNYSSDLDFLVSYQMGHMFIRYLLWNYSGKASTVQDSGVDWSKLYGIPFFIGLFGLYFHFRKDWKLASVLLMLFIFLGFLTAFYQNQQQPQPRERDYFYVGAFFVYSIWIAIGVRGIIDLISERLKNSGILKTAIGTTLFLSFILIPVNMLKTSYWENDRSKNYVPWDYAYNMLQSVKPDAIIFTNGDNDTFPLWYMQDVEGVRRDVRIANLSLLNTPWYIKQLKNTTPHGAMKVEMTYDDNEIDRIGPQRWEPTNMSIPVSKEVIEQYGVTDTSVVNTGKITWKMDNTAQFGNIKAIRVQDIIVLDIIRADKWDRPIYFAVTCSEDSKIGLNDYLIMEGLALKLTPKKGKSNFYYVDENILKVQLFDEPESFSKDYQPGYKFRGLNDSTIFFDDNHSRLTQNYRNSFMRLALHYLYNTGNNEMAVKTLDQMEKKIPRKIIEIDYRLLYDIGSMYLTAGGIEQYNQIAKEIEVIAKKRIEANPRDFNSQYNPYRMLKEIYENQRAYGKLVDLFLNLQSIVPNDPNIPSLLNKYRQLAQADTLEVVPKILKPQSQP